MDPDDDLVQAFLEESGENLDQLDLDLVALEENPRDPELLARVFRTVHTIKGTCGFLGYHRLETLSHAGEDVLGLLRSGDLQLNVQITTALLALVDAVRLVLDSVAETGDEGDRDHGAVIAQLRACLPDADPEPDPDPDPDSAHSAERGTPEPPADPPRADPPAGDPAPAPPSPAPPSPPPAPPSPPPAPPSPPPASPEPGRPAPREDTSVRIDVAVLDQLQDMVGELTLARLRIGESIADDDPLAQPFRRLTLITRDLQETVMHARLQRIAVATGRLPRVVRDVAAEQGKQVHLEIVGDDVTVDKTINEVIRDPLVHLVRNAVDHGVEAPADRVAAGKPPQALVRVSAAHVGGGVHIDVTDDGRGIDTAALIRKVVSLGLRSPQEVEGLSTSEAYALLFLPGVSTAEQVTNVSGRGVGMDVVRSRLEAVGGNIEVWSQPSKGSTFRISVPLTLAVLPAIIVDCGPARFTIPQSDVRSVVRVPEEELAREVHVVGEARFLRDRGTLLPLIDLAEYLGVSAESTEAAGLVVVVVDRGDRRYGLIVDAVGDSVEAVVKPLPRAITRVTSYSGTTVLADGRPSLILDTSAPARAADIHQEPAPDPAFLQPEIPVASDQLLSVFLGPQQMVLPLDRVQRLVRFSRSGIEFSGHEEVVQHEGLILPIIRLATLLELDPADESGDDGGNGDTVDPGDDRVDEVTLVVCRSDVGPVAFMVDDVRDIHLEPVGELEPIEEFGYLGRRVIAGRVTEFLDIDALVDAGLPHRADGTGGVA